MKTKKKYGKLAEWIAAFYLACKGYRILARNVITGRGTTAGEIDIIACRGRCLVFVEVKKRQSLEQAAFSISEMQRNRIRRGAEAYLSDHPEFQHFDIRFDAVLIKLPASVIHLANVW